jgi:hypothetical protein
MAPVLLNVLKGVVLLAAAVLEYLSSSATTPHDKDL